MRIGVDLTCLANDRGYGRFTRELVPAMMDLAPDDVFVCFADDVAAKRFRPPRDDIELIRRETGVASEIPKASFGSDDGERWTHAAVRRWGQKAIRCRPLTGLVTR